MYLKKDTVKWVLKKKKLWKIIQFREFFVCSKYCISCICHLFEFGVQFFEFWVCVFYVYWICRKRVMQFYCIVLNIGKALQQKTVLIETSLFLNIIEISEKIILIKLQKYTSMKGSNSFGLVSKYWMDSWLTKSYNSVACLWLTFWSISGYIQ